MSPVLVSLSSFRFLFPIVCSTIFLDVPQASQTNMSKTECSLLPLKYAFPPVFLLLVHPVTQARTQESFWTHTSFSSPPRPGNHGLPHLVFQLLLESLPLCPIPTALFSPLYSLGLVVFLPLNLTPLSLLAQSSARSLLIQP